MRVLVCGGRDYFDYENVCKVLDQYYTAVGISVIIHGGATGADKSAGDYAEDLHIPCYKFPANWNKYGKAAGPIRNKQMLEEGKPDVVIAFPGGKGTANMIKQAQEAGIRVITIESTAVPNNT
jgi:YspA, cpYpsA-related SLOG family